jgi:hypothetical protein
MFDGGLQTIETQPENPAFQQRKTCNLPRAVDPSGRPSASSFLPGAAIKAADQIIVASTAPAPLIGHFRRQPMHEADAGLDL